MEKLPKQFKKAYKLSSKRGWSWTKNTNHIEVRDANGQFVTTISTTMFDGPLSRKIMSQLRNAGCPGV